LSKGKEGGKRGKPSTGIFAKDGKEKEKKKEGGKERRALDRRTKRGGKGGEKRREVLPSDWQSRLPYHHLPYTSKKKRGGGQRGGRNPREAGIS